jgi:Zn-dependent M28 family amino/carboxypeptidase
LPVPTARPAAIAPAPDEPAPPSCIDGTPYDLDVMRDRLEFLAAPELDGRAPETDGDLEVRELIVEQFTCLGLTPVTESGFEVPFETEDKKTANVVGYIAGADPDVGSEIVFVGAHHDHLGKGYLGANDNASGVVALLAIAHAIRQGEAPKRTVVFATFGAEEEGMVGSYHLARHPPAAIPTEKIVQFINLDMVGSHSSRGYVAALGALPKLAVRKPLEKLVKKYPKLSVAIGGRARGSDFLPYCKRGVPYVFFWTPDAHCYHEKCDTADRIDYPRMLDITKLAGELTITMANTDADLLAARTKLGCGV